MYIVTKGYILDAGIRHNYCNAFAVWFMVGLIEGERVCGTIKWVDEKTLVCSVVAEIGWMTV